MIRSKTAGQDLVPLPASSLAYRTRETPQATGDSIG